MAPKDRFQELKNEGYCFQCLFSGISQDKGKHSGAMCQRNFVCQHKLHDKYPIKKHVLVCNEHRNNAENQKHKYFHKYKDRFIMKQQTQLPSFSKNLRLTF